MTGTDCGCRRGSPAGYPAMRRAGGAGDGLTSDPMSWKLGLASAEVGRGTPRAGGAGDCSAFPPDIRVQVAAAWEPLSRIYQAFAGFAITTNASVIAASGPLAFITGPFVVLGVLLNVLPYVVIEVLLNCNLGQQVQRQARLARENLDMLNMVPDATPIPGLGDIKRAVGLVRPFLLAAEQGNTPSLASVTKLAQAAGILDQVPAPVVSALTGLVEAAGLQAPAPPPFSKWIQLAGNEGAKAITDTKRRAMTTLFKGSPWFLPEQAAAAKAATTIPYPPPLPPPPASARESAIPAAKPRARAAAAEKAAANAAAGRTMADVIAAEKKKEQVDAAKDKARASAAEKAKANAASGKTFQQIVQEEAAKEAEKASSVMRLLRLW
jgi:hypothetical protein